MNTYDANKLAKQWKERFGEYLYMSSNWSPSYKMTFNQNAWTMNDIRSQLLKGLTERQLKNLESRFSTSFPEIKTVK